MLFVGRPICIAVGPKANGLGLLIGRGALYWCPCISLYESGRAGAPPPIEVCGIGPILGFIKIMLPWLDSPVGKCVRFCN